MTDRIEFDVPLPRLALLRREENPRVVSGLWFCRDHALDDTLCVRIGRSRIPCGCRLLERNPEGVSVLRFNATIRTRSGFKWMRFCRESAGRADRVVARHLVNMPPKAAALPPLAAFDYGQGQAALLATMPVPRRGPRVSVLMPVFNPPPKFLAKAIASVRAQTYPNWELCIADDASTDTRVRDLLRREAALDPRIRLVLRPDNGHISAASNSALALATGEWCAFLDQDDELAPQALAAFVHALRERPDAALAYSDEDKIAPDGRRFSPYHKPGWMPELLLGQNFISHLGIYRADRLRSIGGFREGVEGCQDWDLVLRHTLGLPAERVIHLPFVLYHWRVLPGSTARSVSEKPYVIAAARSTARDALAARALSARLDPLCPGQFRVELIPPDRPVVTVLGLASHADRDRLAGLTSGAILRFGADPSAGAPLLIALHESVRAADTALVVLMTPNLLPRRPDWLRRLAAAVSMPGVAAAAGALIDSGGRVAGGALGLDPARRAAPSFQGLAESDSGYFGRAHLLHNPDGLDLRGIVLRRDALLAAGAIRPPVEDDPVADGWTLCAALRASGARVVHDPGVQLDLAHSASSEHPREHAPRLNAVSRPHQPA